MLRFLYMVPCISNLTLPAHLPERRICIAWEVPVRCVNGSGSTWAVKACNFARYTQAIFSLEATRSWRSWRNLKRENCILLENLTTPGEIACIFESELFNVSTCQIIELLFERIVYNSLSITIKMNHIKKRHRSTNCIIFLSNPIYYGPCWYLWRSITFNPGLAYQ